jgi:capsular polysaccharide biosynthesis protein
MISAPWDDPDLDGDETGPSHPAPTLVSLHFVRSALRRRWLVCVLSTILGLLVAAASLVAFPSLHDAKAALVLAHQAEDDSSRAMATDVSLLKTRTLAAKTVASLGLAMTPDDFLKSVTAEPVSSELLSITLTAPSDAEAVRRLEALTSIYLDFRSQQISMQSNVYVQGIQQRITKLQGDVEIISQRIAQLSAGQRSSAGKLSDAIAQRAFVQGRIDSLQQEVEDVTLQTTSVVLSSRVIDPAATESHAAKRRIALTLASGLIGGAALGCGTVLFLAITSDRLRRRSDVAAGLGVPVPLSVDRIGPISERWLWLPVLRRIDSRRDDERHRLAHAIEMELPVPSRSGRLAVVCLDNADEVRFAVSTAAMNLAKAGSSVALIDLTKQGGVDLEAAPWIAGSAPRPTVLRPRGISELAVSAADLRVVGNENENPASLELTDVTLVLADLNPSVGADYLTAWTNRVIIAVTAGRSSAEMVRTSADLVRTAGLEFQVAALLHTEPTDDSSGTAGFDLPTPAAVHLVRDQVTAVAKSDQEKQAGNEEPADLKLQIGDEEEAPALEEQVAADDQLVEKYAAGELIGEDEAHSEQEAVNEEEVQAGAIEDQPADQQQPPEKEQLTAERQASAEEQAAVLEQQPVDEERPSADQEQVAAEEDEPSDQQHAVEEQRPDEEQPSADQEQVAAEEDEPSDQQHAVEEQRPDEEQPSADQEQVAAEEDEPSDQQHAVEEQRPDEEQPSADQEQVAAEEDEPSDQQHAVEEQRPDEEQPAEEELVSEEESAAVLHEQAADEDHIHEETYAAVIAEQLTQDEQAADLSDPAAALEEQLTDEELSAEESTKQDEVVAEQQTREEELAEIAHAQPTYELPSLDGDPTIQVRVAFTFDEASGEQKRVIEEIAKDGGVERQLVADPDLVANRPEQTTGGRRWEFSFVENPVVQIEPNPGANQLDWNWDWLDDAAARERPAVVGSQDELLVEPDDVPYPSLEDMRVNGWVLYIDVYRAGSKPLAEDEELNWNWNWDWDLTPEDSGSKQESAVEVRARESS